MQEELHNITIRGNKTPADATGAGKRFDPKTGRPLAGDLPAAGGVKMNFDPKTGRPLAEAAAAPAAEAPKARFDPKTGRPLAGDLPAAGGAKMNFDPKTGRPLAEAATTPAAPPAEETTEAYDFELLPMGRRADKGLSDTALYQLDMAHGEEPAGEPPASDEPMDRHSYSRDALSKVQRERPAAERSRSRREAPPKKRKGRIRRGIFKTLGVVGVVLVAVVVLIVGAIRVVTSGNFPNAEQLFVASVTETSAIKFLAYAPFTPYSKEDVAEMLAANTVLPITEVTDVTKPFEEAPVEEENTDPIEIQEVSGNTFVGKMMIVKDPSRVELRCLSSFGSEVRGKKVEDFATEYSATAAINAGFFDDPGGVGKGGQPLGLLIQDGVIRNGSTGMESTIIGFDTDNHLVVGKMTGQQALDMNIRDAVTVEPTIMPPLIVNGNPVEYTGNGSGLNPRTALGQRADGAVLMLVIDGRQPHSLGATIQDCLDLMLEYGAINASMQDGGSSSVMWYEGETINVCSSLYGSRSQPSAWLVF